MLFWVRIKGQDPNCFRTIKSVKEYIEKWTGVILYANENRTGITNNEIPIEIYQGGDDGKKVKGIGKKNLVYLLSYDPLDKNIGKSKMSYKDLFRAVTSFVNIGKNKICRGERIDIEPILYRLFLTHLENIGVHNGLRKHTKLYMYFKKIMAHAKNKN